MMDEREREYRRVPTVTPEREQAWTQWKEDYAVTCGQGWLEQGETREDVIRAVGAILADLAQIDDLPWMPLGEALGWRVTGLLSSKQLEGDDRVSYLRSLRTAETSTPQERTLSAAYSLGISVQQAAAMRDRADTYRGRETSTAGRTALYRHYDATGELLYVGIAKEPDKRGEQHRYHSKWFRFVADTQVEWFDSRSQAEVAEREAIAAELPIFNKTHNKANRAAAIDYLFGALEGAATSQSKEDVA